MIRYMNLSKKYSGNIAIDNLTLDIMDGVVTALLGPNGSGKSTLIKMTLGLIKPTSGRVLVDGMDPFRDPIKIRMITGYSPEEVTLFESLTPLETLNFIGSLYGLGGRELEERIGFYVSLFKLGEHMDKLGSDLSHGNRRKLSIICALIHEPKYLILDEPFSGLDPEAGRILKELMRKYASMGRLVIFTTHILEIAEAVADEIIILNRGRVVARGSPEELRALYDESRLESIFMEVTGLSSELEQLIRSLWGR